MGITDIKLDRTIIHYADDSVNAFINEWHNSSDYIYAHTSGSTGLPKKIELSKTDMIKSASATCEFFNINENSKLLLPLSPDYIAGKMMIVRAIVSGADLFIEKPSNSPFKQDYGEIDLMPIVPSQISALIQSTYCHNIKNVIIGGGSIPNDSEINILKSKIDCYATYGMTETCSHIALRKIENGNIYFKCLSGISVSVDDRECLVINAPNFSFNKIVTNDIVELKSEQEFKWIGRWDNVINSGGVKIFPEEIEKELSTIIPYPFYIMGTSDNKWGEIVTLYIENENVDTQYIEKKIRNYISNPYAIPKKIIKIREFKRTLSGKIKRIAF